MKRKLKLIGLTLIALTMLTTVAPAYQHLTEIYSDRDVIISYDKKGKYHTRIEGDDDKLGMITMYDGYLPRLKEGETVYVTSWASLMYDILIELEKNKGTYNLLVYKINTMHPRPTFPITVELPKH